MQLLWASCEWKLRLEEAGPRHKFQNSAAKPVFDLQGGRGQPRKTSHMIAKGRQAEEKLEERNDKGGGFLISGVECFQQNQANFSAGQPG